MGRSPTTATTDRRPRAGWRRGMSILEVVIACVIMAVISIPLLELFQGGIRTTRATIQEVVGTNLGAELSEQLATVPYRHLEELCEAGPRSWTSEDGSLADGVAYAKEAGFFFHLSALPPGFTRTLTLEVVEAGWIRILVRVSWPVGPRTRTIELRRVVIRDELLPEGE